jgi:hypothetical protein
MERCEQCGTKIRGRVFSSPLGQRLCARCHDKLVGTAAGLSSKDLGLGLAMAGNDERRPAGILAWIRKSLGRDRS